MADYTWEEAMDWWRNSGDFQPIIRNAATKLLRQSMIEMGCADQGIGSSDVNHEVYYMYGGYLSYLKYCEEHKEEPNMVSFLMDQLADCSL